MTSWSLRRRLAVAVSVLATILIGLVVVAAVLLLQVRSQQRKVIDRYFTAVSVSNTRFIEQVDTETGIRGYALTGDQVMLQPTKEFGSPKYVAEATKMRTLLRGDPTTIASFDAWDRAAQKWYTDWAAPTIAEVVTNGGDSVTTQQVLAGKTLFDANRAAFGAFAHQLVERRNSASHALQLRTTLLFAAVLLVTIGVGLAGAASWWTLRLWVLVPLASLGAEARLVKSGALDHEVTVEGPAEVRAVADDVEAMRREIVEQLAEVERARVEIESARIRLEKQAAELSRSNRDLEQFAYVASHDLQEPLRKVASFCQMLERRYSGQLDERADQYIAFAVDGAKRMQQLINDLLAFSRVGRQAGSFVEVDLQDCLEQALDNLSVVIRASDAQVRADSLPHVLGDAGLLSQLLQNLIGNSIKFRSEASPRMQIGAEPAGEFWEFSFADNGIGVDEHYAERIFVIFQRLHAKDEYDGTGIGLALCKRIVEFHGGVIWLDTSATTGAIFRWTLPVAPDDVGHTHSTEERGPS